MDKVFLVLMQPLFDGSDGIGWGRLGGIILVDLLAVYLAQERHYHHGDDGVESACVWCVSGKKSREERQTEKRVKRRGADRDEPKSALKKD